MSAYHLSCSCSLIPFSRKMILAIICLNAVSCLFGQLTQETYSNTYQSLLVNRNPHDLTRALFLVEGRAGKANDEVKSVFISQIIKLTAVALSKRDLTISENSRLPLWPDYSGTEYGGNPLYAGVDPRSIEDPRIRDAYSKKLAEHQAKLRAQDVELNIISECNYCFRIASRVIELGQNKDKLRSEAEAAISLLQGDQWIKDKIRHGLFGAVPTAQATAAQRISPSGKISEAVLSKDTLPEEQKETNLGRSDFNSKRATIMAMVVAMGVVWSLIKCRNWIKGCFCKR